MREQDLVSDIKEVEKSQLFPNLNQLGIIYAFSTIRFGNMSFNYSPAEEVLENRQRFARAVGFNLEEIIAMNPEHGTTIKMVDSKQYGSGTYDLTSALRADVLVTENNGALIVNAADCSPIIVTNKKAQFLALVHAGRDGTEKKVALKAINFLHERGYNPADFIVGIGPSIICYELDYLKTTNPEAWFPFISISAESEDQIVANRLGDLEPPVYKISRSRIGKIIVDLVGYNIAQLIEAGVPKEQIDSCDVCTACNFRDEYSRLRYYSHEVAFEAKKAGDTRYPEGRFMAVAKLI